MQGMQPHTYWRIPVILIKTSTSRIPDLSASQQDKHMISACEYVNMWNSQAITPVEIWTPPLHGILMGKTESGAPAVMLLCAGFQ